ncbi:hypothetical protein QOZ80_7AG0559350 [Eleusine coracana subsp. coracana]|nr:hypothetical protein QOZ80_7AG0559350 [Eleusine coracana subsp. coracana]
MFKRSVAFQECDDFEVAERVVPFAHEYKFADLLFWYPGQGKAAYRIDDRVPVNMSGDGVNDFVGFRAIPTPAIQARRLTEDGFEMAKNAVGQCLAAKGMTLADAASNYGMMNADLPVPVLLALTIPGKPVVRVRLWELNPAGVLCGVEMYGGVMMRFVRGSSALLRKPEGSVDFDLSYYRRRWHCAATSGSRTRGKNRNVTFEGATAKYGGSAWAEEFERVRRAYDPEGLFTNEWSNQVLGIGEGVSVVRDGCALEGPCMCSVDTHCAPDRGYLCRPGRVYEEARVCRHSSEL